MLTAMIFAANPDLTAHVSRMCSEVQDISLYRSLDHYPQVREAMQLLNSYAPQLLFLETDDEDRWLALEPDIRSFHPGTAIIRISSRCEDGLFPRSEAFPILQLPCDRETFSTAIYRALEAQTSERKASVFAFLPAKAGSGATTMALFVTNILSRMVHKKVLLLECDLHAGPVSMLYNIRPDYSIMDALEESHRLTEESWKRLTTNLNGVDVLPSVSQHGVRRVSPWGYQRLLAFARSRYDVVICDLPEVVNEATEVVVRAAKATLIVTTPSAPSLRLTARRQHDLEDRGVAVTKVKYVLNRKLDDQMILGGTAKEIEAARVAEIPVDENLFDASEFNPNAANAKTVAGCMKIAEFCHGSSIETGAQPPKKRFFSSLWFGAGPRAPQLTVEHAGRS